MLHHRYRLTGQLGAGAFGTVLKGADTLLADKAVAIKRVPVADANPAEMAFLARLKHPSIPHVQDFFEDNGCSYLVMEYIEGQTLADRMSAGQPLPADEVLTIGLTICDVLHYLHSQTPPIIFRDLKPENVIVTPQGHLYLIDFGIARIFKPGQNKDTYALGSDGYAPPEQYSRKQTDARSDVYALGALLYYLLTGDDPSDHPLTFTHAQISNPNIRHIIEMCTRLDMDQRYDSAQTVACRLRSYQQTGSTSPFSKPIAPAPVSSPVQVTVPASQVAPTKVLTPAIVQSKQSIAFILAEEDEGVAKEIKKHLSVPIRNYRLTVHESIGGRPPQYTSLQDFQKCVMQSHVVLILISNGFWGDKAFDVWRDTVMPVVQSGNVRVIPILVQKDAFDDTTFEGGRELAKLLCLPRHDSNGRTSIAEYRDKDAVYSAIGSALKAIIKDAIAAAA